MISLDNKSFCCGCGNCARCCPTKAIKIVPDDAGFLVPTANLELCVNCGLCEAKCPVLNHKNEIDIKHTFYAAYANDKKDRLNGSSGGMFGIFAKNIISHGGVVFGAAFDDNLKLKCTKATDVEELVPLYKSKYLQSDLGNSFFEIKELLDAGKQVLFVSTPCQVYALKLFLDKEYANLTTIDFVCHGVPSQVLFDKCKKYTENEENIEMVDYSFRAKKPNGSTPHYYKIKYKKEGKLKEKIVLYTDSYFYYGFQKYITLRDSCYDCQFSYSNRVSDITIGDFHEIERYVEGINRFDGVSSVVINTQKGRELWEESCDRTTFYNLDFQMLLDKKELMCGGTVKPKSREQFVSDLITLQFDEVIKKYLNGKKEYTKKLYYKMPKILRKIMKKVLIK